MKRFRRAFLAIIGIAAAGVWSAQAQTQAPARKPAVLAESYVIEAELVPERHELTSRARVDLLASETASNAVFQLHPNLKVSRVTDAAGKSLVDERLAEDTFSVQLGQPLAAGQRGTIYVEYSGTFSGERANRAPKLAYIGPEGSYLLYAARWFPVTDWSANRFKAEFRISVPAGMTAVAPGDVIPNPGAAVGKSIFAYRYDIAAQPGTLVAGVYQPTPVQAEGLAATFYLKPEHAALAAPYGEAAGKIFSFFSDRFGPLPWRHLSIIEIPDGSLPSFNAPGLVLFAERSWDPKVNYKLLAREVAAQWWGGLVRPATPADAWLGDGLARYAEALYVQHLAGDMALSQMLDDFIIGALLYEDAAPVASGRLKEFTPEYRSVIVNKGAMIFHMLRGVLGDPMFLDVLRTFFSNFANRSATTKDFQEIVNRATGQDLNYFFAEWLYSTGIPNLSTDYVIYRTQKGFKVVGKINQDLDIFRMPIEVKIETEGNPETRKVEVIGTSSDYIIETFGRPKTITLDPNNNILKWNPGLQVRVAVARGEELVEQSQPYEAVREYQKALDVNRNSSLANFRIGEAFFAMNNYQASANAFREALNGDLAPKWTEVWSHIYLGKIYDLTGSRERALREYQKALDTNDNTQGAQNEAQRWLNEPYKAVKIG